MKRDHLGRGAFGLALGIILVVFSTSLAGQGKGNGHGNGGGGGSADWAIASTGWGGYTVGPVVLMTADGSQTSKITNFDIVGPPRWSPDDQRLVFALKNGAGGNSLGVYTIGVDGTGLTMLAPTTERASGVDWSPVPAPDGEDKIAFCVSGELYVVSSDGSGLQELNSAPSWDGFSFFNPSWAPTGDRIVVESFPSAWVLDLAEVAGQLTISAATSIGPGGPLEDKYVLQPSWSPLGDRIVVCAIDFVTTTGVPDGIWSIDLASSQQTWLGIDGRRPDLNADATQIVFAKEGDLWMMFADGSGAQPFIHGRKQGAENPSWRTRP